MDESTNKKPDGGPAFPRLYARSDEDGTSGMSLRAYAAIRLRVPDSGIDWLDSMIDESNRNQLAGMVAQGIHASCFDSESYPDPNRVSEEAYKNADHLIARGEQP